MLTIFKDWRVTLFGLLSWAIPFAASIPFFSPDTGLIIPLTLFKSLMVVIGSGSGIWLLVWAFKRAQPGIFIGFVVGIYWLIINWVLDFVVLLPMSGDTPLEYFYDIGLRYLVFPIMAAALAFMGRTKA